MFDGEGQDVVVGAGLLSLSGREMLHQLTWSHRPTS